MKETVKHVKCICQVILVTRECCEIFYEKSKVLTLDEGSRMSPSTATKFIDDTSAVTITSTRNPFTQYISLDHSSTTQAQLLSCLCLKVKSASLSLLCTLVHTIFHSLFFLKE